MTEPARWSLEELVVWHSWGRFHERFPHVADPRGFVPPEDPETAKEQLRILQDVVDTESFSLTAVSCLAAVLSQNNSAFSTLRSAFLKTLSAVVPGFESRQWARIAEASWTLIPILVDTRPKACAVWFAVGLDENAGSFLTPRWWESVADNEAQRAAGAAAKLVHLRSGCRLLVLPVLLPSGRQCLFGASLALPLYLAGWGLHVAKRPEHMAATGALREDGVVGPVSAVPHKARAAEAVGRRALICPSHGFDPETARKTPLTLLPVQDVEAAEYLWETFQDQNASKVLSDFERLSNPIELAHTVHLLDPRAGGWQGFPARYRNTVIKIAREPRLAEEALDRLAKMVRDPYADAAWVERLLEPWDFRCFEVLAEENPMAAFQAAQLRWAAATRRGEVKEAHRWMQRCESVQARVLQYPDGIYKVCDFLNRRIVSERHARYRFDPELPQEVWDTVRRLEEERSARARNGLKPAAPALGKLYGTIAQNYGFCGPKFGDAVGRYVSEAQDAFGLGQLPQYRADWRRQFHYRLYAELDAENWAAASETLRAYGIAPAAGAALAPRERPFDKMSPYEHAALARYLAETGSPHEPSYLAWALERMRKPLPGHPWPLWLWNMGRIFQKKVDKERAWRMSMELSLSLGPTARPMALLPLAWLRCEGLETASRVEPHVMRVMDDLAHGPLWRPHFRELLDGGSVDDILETILLRAAGFFPFTYR